MEQQTEKPKRRPSIEVRCPKCGMREIWHHLPKGGDRCRWCGHLFEDFTYRKVGPGAKGGRAMKNWERYFGTPEAAMRMEVRMMRDGRRFRIAVSECNPSPHARSNRAGCGTSPRGGEYQDWLNAEYDDGTIKWEEDAR